jgi:hypothetical protein
MECAPSGRGPQGRSHLGPYSKPAVINLTRWVSGLKFPLEDASCCPKPTAPHDCDNTCSDVTNSTGEDEADFRRIYFTSQTGR